MKKWYIISGENDKAGSLVYNSVIKYTDVKIVKSVNSEIENENLIYVGTKNIDCPENGYVINAKTVNEQKIITLFGDGYENLLYSAIDFENKFIAKWENADEHTPIYYFNKPFIDDMPDYSESFVPKIKNRALWTWGHVIYDYKGYLDNMLRLKLNMVIIWNDTVPKNANDLVLYAHECGIKVIWGFSWGWDTHFSEKSVEDLEALSNSIVENFEKNYSNANGDGIYFQTFTELNAEKIGDVLIAEAAVSLVNNTSKKLLEKYPNLCIQFGLHATSVKEKLEYIKKTDNRVSILWEDCGAFPYAYIPKAVDEFDKTIEFTRKIKNLRSGGFGCVLKGMTALDWSSFSHDETGCLVGLSPEKITEEKIKEKKKIWKYLQAYWIKNAKYLQKTINEFDENTIVSALVEDGLFERYLWYPVAIYAEILFNPKRDIEDILCETALIPTVKISEV